MSDDRNPVVIATRLPFGWIGLADSFRCETEADMRQHLAEVNGYPADEIEGGGDAIGSSLVYAGKPLAIRGAS